MSTAKVVTTLPWWRALYLSERKPLLEIHPTGQPLPEVPSPPGEWGKLGAVRKQGLEQALTPHGISADDLIRISRSDDALLRSIAARPKWVNDMEHFAQLGANYFERPFEERRDDRELASIGNLVVGAQRALRLSLEERTKAEPLPVFVEAALSTVPLSKLSLMCSRVAVVAMHDRARAGHELSFDRTLEELSTGEGQQELFNEFPVLARCVVETLSDWIHFQREVLDHLIADADELLTHLGVDVRADQVDISFGAGDTHHRGRTVGILTFDSKKVIYKPRSAVNDSVLSECLGLLHGHVEGVPNHLLWLDRGDHSWYEFVDDTRGEIEDWAPVMRGLGILTTTLYLLQANDFHHENIVFSQGRPIAVDTETLFHTDRRVARANVDFNPVGQTRIMDSIHSVGVTPSKILGHDRNGDPFTTDISAVGYRTGQRSVLKVPRMVNHGQDDAHIIEDNVLEAEINPDIDAAAEGMLTCAADFRSGVRDTLRFFEAHRQELDTFLEGRGQGASTRIVRRPTMVYARVLTDSYHPDYLRDGLSRELVVSKLLDGFWFREDRDLVVSAEMEAIRAGDIPHFVLPVDEVPSDSHNSVLEQVRERAGRRLDRSEIEYELSVVDLVFAAAGSPVGQAWAADKETPRSTTEAQESSKLLSSAVKALHTRVSWGPEGTASIATLSPLPTDEWVVTSAGPDVYGGLAGLSIAAARAAQVTGDPLASELERGFLRSTEQFSGLLTAGLQNPDDVVNAANVGAWGPIAGYGTVMAETARKEQLDECKEALRAVQLTRLLVGRDGTQDLLSGSAGAIRFAASVADMVPADEVRETIAAAADELLRSSVPQQTGIAWLDQEYERPLCGFSHGAAGIACALMEAHLIVGRQDYRDAALEALRFDTSKFDPSAGNWPDLRYESGPEDSLRAWCHGTAGGVLARALLHPYLEGPDLAAADSVLAAGGDALAHTLLIVDDAPLSASLCHGLAGNLLVAQRLVRDGLASPMLADAAKTASAALGSTGRRQGLQLGGAPGALTPDLMMGLSGTIWAVAQTMAPEDKLTFDPLTGGSPSLGGIHV